MTSRMRLRAMLATGTIAVVAAPATAFAGGLDFGIAFNVGLKDGKPSVIKNLKVVNVPVNCSQGTTNYTSSKQMPKMAVSNRLRFSGRTKSSGTTLKVTGKYNRKLERIKGTVKVKGKVGGYSGCSSGKLRWKSI